MPYAFAHPAAAVPLAKLLGRRAVASALVIGSMIPDAWYFTPELGREPTHDPVGALLLCLPAGLIVYAAFHLIFKQPMLALAPRRLAGRLAAWTSPSLPEVPWLWVVLSMLTGIATHLAWDAFTHAGGAPLLEARVFGNVRLHQVLQHASTLLGSAFLGWWLWRRLQSTRPATWVHAVHDRVRTVVLAMMAVCPIVAFVAVLHALEEAGLRTAMRAAGVTALSAFGFLALSFSLAWKAMR